MLSRFSVFAPRHRCRKLCTLSICAEVCPLQCQAGGVVETLLTCRLASRLPPCQTRVLVLSQLAIDYESIACRPCLRE